LAVARTDQDGAVIRLLLDAGADVSAQSNTGETAQDWARKLASPAALRILALTPRPETPALVTTARSVDAKSGAERGLALLESSSQKFSESSGCASCHHQNATSLAASEARARGLRVNDAATAARIAMMTAGVPPPPIVAEHMDIGVPEILASALVALAAEGVAPSPATDLLAVNLAAAQSPDGSWHISSGIGDRPPTAEGSITRAVLCMRSLEVYAPPARAAEINARLATARQWLLAATPVTAEDRNMQLLGLYWAGVESSVLRPIVAAILAEQRPDGGWRQQAALGSDPYATGQSLYVLAKAGGIAATDARYRLGIAYLLATQSDTGAWHVASRAPKFQAYFNSGFPYGGDQFISAWATSWATMALVQAVPVPVTRAER